MLYFGAMKRILPFLSAALLSLAAASAPQLKPQAEVLAAGELKAKVLAGSRGVPPMTPAGQMCRVTRGDEVREYKVFEPADLWRARAEIGSWEDRKGNVQRVARVLSGVPAMDRIDCSQEGIDARLDELEKDFKPTDENLEAWRRAWGPKGTGRFVRLKTGRVYWVEFAFAETVSPAAAQKLLQAFERSVSASASAASASGRAMKWWETKNAQYAFLTDLDPAKGKKFVADSMKLMTALRKGFEYYVPPKGETAVGKVRVFRRKADYQAYRKATGTVDLQSCGLWDPNRDELLIVAESPEEALATMRHESFHQYLHYATKRGDHAPWFNEGHATFFENVKYNPAKNTIRVIDTGNRATWVDRDPVRVANAIPRLLELGHDDFSRGDVNLNYVTAWAVCYFLEKGCYAAEEFAPYRGICARYLELMEGGASPFDATVQAWSLVKGRDVPADFLKFWRAKRKAALGKRL